MSISKQRAVFEHKNDLGDWALGWEVFDWIASVLAPGRKILELGSGAGTAVLCKHWSVTSIEHNQGWLGKYPGAKYILAPLVDGWYDTKVLREQMPRDYDFLIIDGPPAETRAGILRHVDLFNWDVPVVVDDVQRDADMRIAQWIATKKGLSSVEVRSTSYARKFVGFPGKVVES